MWAFIALVVVIGSCCAWDRWVEYRETVKRWELQHKLDVLRAGHEQ